MAKPMLIMSEYSFLLFLFLICIALPLTLQQQNPLAHFCTNDRGNFTANSTFSSNLDGLSSALSSAAPSPGGFYNISIGQVNSISLCRGDVAAAPCRDCITNATAELRRRCPNQKEAVIWYDSCMVRYSNRSIYGSQENLPMLSMTNQNNVTGTSVQDFNQLLGDLLDRLRARAAGGSSTRKFATGNSTFDNFRRIYALVQCTPDLSELQCSSCLSQYIGEIPSCCNGRIGARRVGPSCNFRYEIDPFYDPSADAPSSAPPTAVDAAPPPLNGSTGGRGQEGSGNSSRTIGIAVGISAAAVIVVLCAGIFAFTRLRKRKQRIETIEAVDDDGIGGSDASQYDFETIKAATDDFALANKLGQGGFGPVYKGKLGNGQEIAVKRLSKGSGQGDLEFKNEVLLVAKLQHRNLVRLLGFSFQGSERLLVYEFVPNASLDHFLFDAFKRRELDWERRNKIIGGIAKGLLYLHEDSRLRIIHRDLKASNILLDAEMNPKISDFGMAKLFAVDQSQYATSRIVGTYGYMAPEYAMHGQFSVKSDVFSFGVLILEILTGQRNNCFRNGETVEDLLSCAWRNWRDGTALDFVDPALRNGSRTELLRFVHIGLLCVQENALDRPNMANVVLMLTSYSVSLPVPSQPAFFSQSSTQSEASTSRGYQSGATESSKEEVVPMVADVEESIAELGPR